MSELREFIKEQLRDSEMKAEYDALESEYQVINALLDARKEKNMTQKQLAEITGIAQGDISKIENGNANPSLRTLQRLASAMGKKIVINFVSSN